LNKAIDRARLLMTIEPEQVAALQENPCVSMGKPNEIQMLREQVAAQTEQVAARTEQVAALTIKQSRTRQARRPAAALIAIRLVIYNVIAAIKDAFSVVNLAIFLKIVGIRETPAGRLYRATGVPTLKPQYHNDNSPTIITVAAIKSSATVIKGMLGGVDIQLMLDSGSSVSLVQSDVLLTAKKVTQAAARPIQHQVISCQFYNISRP